MFSFIFFNDSLYISSSLSLDLVNNDSDRTINLELENETINNSVRSDSINDNNSEIISRNLHPIPLCN